LIFELAFKIKGLKGFWVKQWDKYSNKKSPSNQLFEGPNDPPLYKMKATDRSADL